MKIFADYHTHTRYSHGKGTIRDNVMVARQKGLKEIAITDHGPRHIAFGISKQDILNMKHEIYNINKEFDDIKILLGVEANIISDDGDIDVSDDIINEFDIILLGYHKLVSINSVKEWYQIFLKNFICKRMNICTKSLIKANTQMFIKAINKYNINVITHPGLGIMTDIKTLAKECANTGTALEINNSYCVLDQNYVQLAVQQGAVFAINSDAHKPENVGNFSKGIDIAVKAGLTSQKIINAL